jgi:hypothetical protein
MFWGLLAFASLAATVTPGFQSWWVAIPAWIATVGWGAYLYRRHTTEIVALLMAHRPIVSACLILAALILVVGLTYRFTRSNHPLEIEGYTASGDKYVGKTVAGIEWKSEYFELRLIFRNQSLDNLEDVSIDVDVPWLLINSIAQVGTFPACSIDPIDVVVPDASVKIRNGDGTLVSPKALIHDGAINAVRRIRCATLPRNAHLELLLALTTPNIPTSEFARMAMRGNPPVILDGQKKPQVHFKIGGAYRRNQVLITIQESVLAVPVPSFSVVLPAKP